MGLFRRQKKKTDKKSKKSEGTYWMSFTVGGKQYRESCKTKNKELARIKYSEKILEIEKSQRLGDETQWRKLKDMIERYEKEYTTLKGYYSEKRDRSIFKHLYAHFGDKATLDTVYNKCGDYITLRRSQEAMDATIVKELGLLRRMHTVARKQWKWKIGPNPVTDIELPEVNNDRSRYLFPAEYKALYEVLDKAEERWLVPMVTVAINCGLRLGNLVELNWDEVDIFGKTIVIAAEKMKNDNFAGIPMTEQARDTFIELQKVRATSWHVFHDNGQPLYAVKVQRAFRKALKAAGITNFHWHDLRHCTGSYLRKAGYDLDIIRRVLTQRDLRSAQRYAHMNVDDLRPAVTELGNFITLLAHQECQDLKKEIILENKG